MRNVTLSMWALAAFAACGEGDKRDPPQTITWDPECQGTLDANTCVTLAVSANDFVRANAPGDVIGTVFWALYKEGDVDLVTGARASDPIYSGRVEDVDLSADNLSHLIHIANMTVQKYHPLLQLDDDLSGGPNDGDAVTLPKPAFNTEAGEHITRNIEFDFLCSGGQCDP